MKSSIISFHQRRMKEKVDTYFSTSTIPSGKITTLRHKFWNHPMERTTLEM
jgi:hypothetical protein